MYVLDARESRPAETSIVWARREEIHLNESHATNYTVLTGFER